MTRPMPSIAARTARKAVRRRSGRWAETASLWIAVASAVGCGSAAPSTRYSDSRGVSAPDTLGAPEEGMPDPALGRGDGSAPEGFGAGPPSRADLDPLRPGWLGVELQASPHGIAGVWIVEVVRRSPAASAGLRSGDIIVQVDGQAVFDPVTLVRRIRATRPGTKLSLGVSRQGKLQLVGIQVEPTPSPDELVARRFVGFPAPPIDGLAVVQGDTPANWNALSGRFVVLEFWAPWCGVCSLMHQRMNEWQAQWSTHGVQVIGIAALSPEQARAFAARFGMGYAVAVDTQESVFRAYDVFAVPSVFLVDRRGTVVDAMTGYSSKRLASMEKRLVALVSEGTRP